jgi:hypothetical protein|tara:strand:- start:621 stop:914 length:294 start_codon:yes stop_codon:yes gene_type:complete
MTYFPISEPMVGSVIPGILIRTKTVISNYPNGTLGENITSRKEAEHPVVSFPDMNNDHSAKHPLMEKLRALMGGKPSGPPMREGYEPVKENLDWKKS